MKLIKWIKKLLHLCDHEWVPLKKTNLYEIYHEEYDYFCNKCGDLK